MDAGILYPNVSSLNQVTPAERADRATAKDKIGGGDKGEFGKVLDQTLGKSVGIEAKPDLSQIKSPLKFSAHATQRLNERKINLDASTMVKVNDAIDKAAAKGVEDTLVLTGDAALIVNVKNRTVVTAMDKGSLNGNVFTNIDGAVIV